MTKAIYPGTFDPITNGHLNLIERASMLFNQLIVGVAKDTTGKSTYLNFEERLFLTEQSLAHLSNVRVKGFEGFLYQFYQQEKGQVIVRGVRSTRDFEYEHQLAVINKQLGGEHVETLFLISGTHVQYISGSLIREIKKLGGDIKPYVPQIVSEFLNQK